VRRLAARALGGCRHQADEAVPALVAALRDRAPEVRLSAIQSLGRLGAVAAEAVDPLLDLLWRDGLSLPARVAVVNALAAIGPAAAEAVAHFQTLLRVATDPALHRAVGKAVRRIAGAPVSAP
jgi:HEAT repeat protein